MKGDVFDVDIGIVSEELVRGKVGTAEVLIPRLKMEEVIFNDKLNEYTTELSNGETVKIASGERIRCRCVDWFTESGNHQFIQKTRWKSSAPWKLLSLKAKLLADTETQMIPLLPTIL